MRTRLLLGVCCLLVVLGAARLSAAEEQSAAQIPSGTDSAEGVACDMAKAFIDADRATWDRITFKHKKPEYSDYLQTVGEKMADIENDPRIDSIHPVKIGICWQLGRLSMDGPNSYAYALGLKSIGFVDVGVIYNNDSRGVTRTLVIQLADESWRALPRPDLFPLLSAGLNDEPRPGTIVYQMR